MGRIIVSENITLDGTGDDPSGEQGPGARSWFDRLPDTDRAAWAEAGYREALAAEALLMGRRTYEWFVARGWAAERTGPWPDRLRALPKHVVSATFPTLDELPWANSTVLDGDAVAKLKHEVAGDIVVYGSGKLVRTLLAQDLVDELRLMVYPVVLGSGAHLFGELDAAKPVRLTGNRTIGTGLALLTYELEP